mgnify:CR=1 FL=1|tara:strand:- start:74 stop:1093 length:1020 start_codon:yes stop_codon:yes gene_type:complete
MALKKQTYIIAEAGINHKGNVNIAKKFIQEAKNCGADAIKFQSFIPGEVVVSSLSLATYQKKSQKNRRITMLEMIKKYELTQEEQNKLYNFSKKIKIDFISSAFDLISLDFLINNLHLKTLKIPSGEITNYPYLRKLSFTKKNIILSTGMSNFKEIQQALKILTLEGLSKKKITLLHCNTAYPTPYKNVNLNVLNELKKKFKLNVGYSDHTLGVEVSVAAVALGASVIEKHFTLNKKWEGPDQKSSLDPKELKKLVFSIRNIDQAMGSKVKRITSSESKNVSFARKSIVAKDKIKKGEKFTIENITVKRPGGGISPMKWPLLINKKSRFNFKKDEKIKR